MDAGRSVISPIGSRRHVRGSSQDIRPGSSQRRLTKGPLDFDFDPLAASQPASGATTPLDTALSPSTSSIASPSTGSGIASTTITDGLKDYSYLIEPQIFRPLPHLDLPEPLRNAPQPPATTSIPSLLLSQHLRGAAISAANLLTSATPTDRATIFSLWFIRLSALTLISPSTTAIAAQEIKVFGDLTSSFYRDTAGEHVVPWELRVLAIRLQALGFSDWRRCLEHFYVLAKEAREKAKSHKEERLVWKARLWDLGIRVGSALIEMGDLDGAARHMEGMISDSKGDERLQFMLALLYVQIGNIKAARLCSSSEIVEALCLMGDNEFGKAVEKWRTLYEGRISGKEMMLQNLAVCLLYTGKAAEARSTLESIVDDRKTVFHSLVFNLCTLYELCGEDAKMKKIGLAEKVAMLGLELTNGSFKL